MAASPRQAPRRLTATSAASPETARQRPSHRPRGTWLPRPPTRPAPKRPCSPRLLCVECVSSLPVFLERQLAIVLAQEIQKPLVVARLHVEELRHYLVIATRVLEPLAHEIAHIAARDLALHVERIDNGPERLPLLHQLLVEVICDRAATLLLRSEADGLVRPDLHRQVLRRHGLAAAGDDQALDDVLEFADVARPRVLAQQLVRVRRDELHRMPVVAREPVHEVVDQRRDVLAAFP